MIFLGNELYPKTRRVGVTVCIKSQDYETICILLTNFIIGKIRVLLHSPNQNDPLKGELLINTCVQSFITYELLPNLEAHL